MGEGRLAWLLLCGVVFPPPQACPAVHAILWLLEPLNLEHAVSAPWNIPPHHLFFFFP